MKTILIILLILSTNIINALTQEQDVSAGKPLTYAKILKLMNNTYTKLDVFKKMGAPNIILKGIKHTTWIYIFYDFSHTNNKMINRSISVTFINIAPSEKIKTEIFFEPFKKEIKKVFKHNFIQDIYAEKPPVVDYEYYDITSVIAKTSCSFLDIELNDENDKNNY